MTASTHTEIYRRFTGTLAPAKPAFLPLYRARLRVALKRKLPLLLLLVPPWITGVIVSFVVYATFSLESAGIDSGGVPIAATLAVAWAKQMTQVHEMIAWFVVVSHVFALLTLTWYGSGLICEDRRAGAHLLYFSRPLKRVDYFLAHFATAFTFGAFVVVLPAMLICVVAVFSSPDYSFLTEKWSVIVGAIAYTSINVAIQSLVVLAISSGSARRTYALGGVFGLFLGSEAIGMTLWRMQNDIDFAMAGLPNNLLRVADWMLGSTMSGFTWDPWRSAAILGAVVLASIALIAWRLRRMEAIA